MTDFKIGDVVKLKSGGPAMTIASEGRPPNTALKCLWFTSEEGPNVDWFEPDTLKIHTQSSGQSE